MTPVKPKIVRVLAGPAEVAGFLAELRAAVADLRGALLEESALVEAMDLRALPEAQARKAEAANRYRVGMETIGANAAIVKAHGGPALAALKTEQAALAPIMERNLAVLATSHAVAEGLIRGAVEMAAAKRAPQGYGAAGQALRQPIRAAGPVVISRSL